MMFRNFIAKEGVNVMIQKPDLTFHRNTEWMKMTATPDLPVSHFSLYLVVISLKTDNGFPKEEKK